MKITISIIISLLIGFIAGRQLLPSPPEKDLTQLEQKLLSIQEIDIAEYQKLKDDRERYLKANEIYGKVMLLFLATLGTNLDHSSWQSLTQSSVNLTKKETEDQKVQEPEIKKEESPSSSLPTAELTVVNPSTDPTYSRTNGKIKNPTQFYQQAKIIKAPNKMLDSLKGNFRGIIYDIVDEEPDVTWDIILQSDYAHNGKYYEGSATIILSSPEKGEFSKSKSDGDNRNFQINQNASQTLIIRVSPHMYIEADMSSKGPEIKGNLYKTTEESKKYQFKAKVKIYR